MISFGLAGCSAQLGKNTQPSEMFSESDTQAPLITLVSVLVERLQIADKVAEAKWAVGVRVVDDPAREATVLDVAEMKARAVGVDPSALRRIFTAQIAANKVVQNGLFERWEKRPGTEPVGSPPDLNTEIRPSLDSITDKLIKAIRAADDILTGPECPSNVANPAYLLMPRLDPLHNGALRESLTSLCS